MRTTPPSPQEWYSEKKGRGNVLLSPGATPPRTSSYLADEAVERTPGTPLSADYVDWLKRKLPGAFSLCC